MKIVWTEPAVDDLHNLHGYIAKDSEVYATNFVERVIDAVGNLSEYPRLGRVVPEADEETIREVLYRSYRIVYRIHGERIEILAVVHGHRDLNAIDPIPWEAE